MAEKERSGESREGIIVIQVIDIFLLALFEVAGIWYQIGCSCLQYDGDASDGEKAGKELSAEKR